MTDDRFIPLADVIKMTGLSRRTIYRHGDDGTFPRRVQVGPNAVRWRLSEVLRWMEAPMEWKEAA